MKDEEERSKKNVETIQEDGKGAISGGKVEIRRMVQREKRKTRRERGSETEKYKNRGRGFEVY